MKKTIIAAAVLLIFFASGCKKEKTGGEWNIKIEDGAEVYNYSGVTYTPAMSDYSYASFASETSFNSSGGGSVPSYTTRSKFKISLGNITRINFELLFNTVDSAILGGLKQSNLNNVRFAALKKIINPGVYSFNNSIVEPFVFYLDKTGTTWVTDKQQSNILEVVSVMPNTQDETANALIAKINFDIALRNINSTATKRVKGSMFSFFNLN
jgi:hypothetical protein